MAHELWTVPSLHISPLPPSCWKLYSRQVWRGRQDLLSSSNQSRDMASHQEGQAISISHFLHSEFQRFNSWWVCFPPSSHSKDEGSTIREAGWVHWDFICLVLAPSGGPAPEVVSQRFWHLTRRADAITWWDAISLREAFCKDRELQNTLQRKRLYSKRWQQ